MDGWRCARPQAGLVDRVSAQCQTADLIALNRRVEIDAVTPARAATGWLHAHGF